MKRKMKWESKAGTEYLYVGTVFKASIKKEKNRLHDSYYQLNFITKDDGLFFLTSISESIFEMGFAKKLIEKAIAKNKDYIWWDEYYLDFLNEQYLELHYEGYNRNPSSVAM